MVSVGLPVLAIARTMVIVMLNISLRLMLCLRLEQELWLGIRFII